ncbi:MAG: ParB/RepB/Spo0J family partition protein [Clostridia bacterium]|nr:ParB/RepB/Spo0J family partition protein [Clostridia bacterium]
MYSLWEKKLLMLKPSEIKPSKNQPRKSFDEYELKLLADSIQSSGIIQPLVVRKSVDGRYEIIAGERRYIAAKNVGLRRIPCILHNTDDKTAAIYAIIENLQRQNLSFFEEAEAINRLMVHFGMSQLEIASRLGLAQSTLSNKLRLLRLSDEQRERIITARLTERHARALLRLDGDERENALNYIIANALNLKESEEYIDDILNPKEKELPPEKPIRKSAISDVRIFYNSLSKLVNTLQSAGVNAKTRKYENDKYIEYKVRISKNASDRNDCEQLKIC